MSIACHGFSIAALQRVVAMLAATERRVRASEQAIKPSEVALELSYVLLGRLRPRTARALTGTPLT
jgi:hypothetical protein